MTLKELLRAQTGIFNTIARSWLEQGAWAFSVWESGQALARWQAADPANMPEDGLTISEPVVINGKNAGWLRASGIFAAGVQERLRTDAELVSSQAPLVRDLYSMAAELVDTRDQLLAIYHLSQSSRNCLEIEQAMHSLVAQLPQIGKSEGAFLLLRAQGEALQVVQHPGAFFPEDTLEKLAQETGPEGYLLINENPGSDLLPAGTRNLLILRVEMRAAGVAAFGLVNKLDGQFLMPDIKLGQAIAAYAGAQLDNVMMFQANMRLARLDTEMELAHQVQLSLLPKEPPNVPGLDVHARTIPALLVGGDFYDFILRPGIAMTFAVGDLSGKGFPAALLMSMTRTVLRTEVNVLSSPERILKGVNQELYDDFTRLGSFATLFLGQYDPGQREIRFANAGHSPVIFLQKGQPAHMLVADGTAMGILPESEAQTQCIRLHPGDVLLVGTDGLVDAQEPGGARFGYERLISFVESLRELSAEEITAQVMEVLVQYRQGVAQEDDQTLVVLKCID